MGEINRHPSAAINQGEKNITLNSCLPHTLEQEGQKSTFFLHPQFAYVESTKQEQQSTVYSKTSIIENRQ